MRIPSLFVIFAFCVAGCGHKGPLYLAGPKSIPQQPQNMVTPDPERPAQPQAVPPPK